MRKNCSNCTKGSAVSELHRPCPFRSDEPIGTVSCSCRGQPVAYHCNHPEVNYPVMLTVNRLASRVLKLNDGSSFEMRSTRLKDCMTCELRPSSSDPLPPLSEQLANFGAAVLRFAKAGMPRADQETYQKRTEICLACPNLTSDGRCTYCGCWISEKSLWLTEHCPEHRWPGESDNANETGKTGAAASDHEGQDLPELPGA